MSPTTNISIEIDKMKYRLNGETFEGKVERIARTLSDSQEHYAHLYEILHNMRFLPAGRVQTATGSPRAVTAFNCFVSGKIEDSMDSIMERAKEAAETMRRGGGIGYNFGHIRPHGDWIKTLDSKSSGPISFMKIYDAICQTIASSGHRRGAQMGVFPISHPDVEAFINAKTNENQLTGFNVSLAVTDEFMHALLEDKEFDLTFEGRTYKTINPRELWDTIMRNTWDWAEPGVLFIDRINQMNNLYYCEDIEATNPCGEQPLPHYGACLLGSFNLPKYLIESNNRPPYMFDWVEFEMDIEHVVRAMDNVIDNTTYPLKQQEEEAKAKRRMGLGITGLANCAEMLGYPYASDSFISFQSDVLKRLRTEAYKASARLAKEKGAFPLFDKSKYLNGRYIKTLPNTVVDDIARWGIRNSHLTSIAPTGTISLSADNVSSGIEPPFSHYYDRTLRTFDGDQIERVEDYAYSKGVKGLTADEISAEDHVKVLLTAQKYIDSACSKTCNVGDSVSFDEFKNLYVDAWKGGAKGLTTFRSAGKRFGILNKVEDEPKAEACYIDPETGNKECDL
tara:strand:+ start:876 stop:2570 length:1695 start_codon:yes stop_codon:yes gene_type:complete